MNRKQLLELHNWMKNTYYPHISTGTDLSVKKTAFIKEFIWYDFTLLHPLEKLACLEIARHIATKTQPNPLNHNPSVSLNP